ncbi:DUF2267 domain-containing protein [Methylosinus sp. Sm6]|uniref:DUF2267 domain-containing protein n=1 Tax=Methylosinus sp. Sm6 TaxID=2866948 RepID=UPI001C99F7CD|nr:DUF2267 domain-containing protein [Methylosinus sp. Sm6]MBY6243288.1 DUF2267 domain-containing protein [Methylosinus sp. Sm6]
MPIPMEYQHASEAFDRFLRLVIERTGLTTRNQAYTTAQGVLLAFRRRLDIHDAIRFAGALPPVLRALFVADWDTREEACDFGSRAALLEEVKSLRRDHNFSPASAIADVAHALRDCVDVAEFERVLATLPAEAADFWRVDR